MKITSRNTFKFISLFPPHTTKRNWAPHKYKHTYTCT